MKRGSVLIMLSLAVLLAGCGRQPVEVEATPAAVLATAVPARVGQGGITILAEGQLAAVKPLLPLAFGVGGRLLSVEVRPGDRVAAGDLIAVLDDAELRGALADAELQVALAENSLAQAQAALDELLNWAPDELAVSVAEANLAAAESNLGLAQDQDVAAGHSLTSARVSLDQAERALGDAQAAYNKAWDAARDWELNDPLRPGALQQERDATERNLKFAEENLELARAQYSLALAGLKRDSALDAAAAVAAARQALALAQAGPTGGEIGVARLQVEQARLSLEQRNLTLAQAQTALAQVRLLAPWAGAVVAVEAAPGAFVSAGAPVISLLDAGQLQFQTTNLSEQDLASVALGQSVTITLKAYPTQSLPGRVVGIAAQPSGLIGDAAVFMVMIDLQESMPALRPGLTGRAEISGRP